MCIFDSVSMYMLDFLSYWKTCFIWQILQIEVLLSDSNFASLYTEHVFKEKEKKTWNVKQESQDLWKQKNVWLQG